MYNYNYVPQSQGWDWGKISITVIFVVVLFSSLFSFWNWQGRQMHASFVSAKAHKVQVNALLAEEIR